MSRNIGDLPLAVESKADLDSRMAGKSLAIFLDYDGTLTPIVDKPELAVMDPAMRQVVSELAGRCPLCIVSGRDRPDVQNLVKIDNLIYAGSHGFDIVTPDGRNIEKGVDGEFITLLDQVVARLHEVMDPIDGALIEPKKASVAAHYRLVAEGERQKVHDVVDEILAKHPDRLKCTPGKMVWEIQPKIDWDKGKAVLYLLEALELDRPDVLPMYFGDDVTDEHAFEALNPKGGLGVFVGDINDPEVAGRTTQGDYLLRDMDEVARFLSSLSR